MKALVPKSALDAEYLSRLLDAWSPRVLGWVRATTADNFPISRLHDLEIPLPPLDQQRRIARILDAADALRTKRRDAIAKLDELRQAAFVAFFGDPRTNECGWPVGQVQDLIESASYGTSAKAGLDGSYPVLRMGNLTVDGRLDMRDLKYMDLLPGERDRYLVHAGDLLFNRTNSPELVGKTAVYRADAPAAFAGYLIRVRMASLNHPEYLAGFLNTSYAKQTLRGMCKSILGMANINAKELRRISIPVVPADLQVRFAAFVDQFERERGRHVKHLQYLDTLFASLQSRAFAGDL